MNKKYSVEQLLKVLATATGWGDCLDVSVSYADRGHRDQDEYVPNWLFGVATTICGSNMKIEAIGKTLEEALLNLVLEIPKVLERATHWNNGASARSLAALKSLEE